MADNIIWPGIVQASAQNTPAVIRATDNAGIYTLLVSGLWTPAEVTWALALQYDAAHCTSNTAGQPVSSVSASYGASRTASQALTLRPTFRTDGIEYDGALAQYMELSSSLVLNGAFTSYHVFNSPAGADNFAIGSITTTALLALSSGGIILYDDIGSGPSLGGASGLILVRVSSDGAGNVSLKATGGLNTTSAGFGTATIEVIGASVNNAAYSGSTANRSIADFITLTDNTGTAENTNMLAWLLSTYGATLS